METDGGLPPTGWFTRVVSSVPQEDTVDREDAEGRLRGVLRAGHLGEDLHPPP